MTGLSPTPKILRPMTTLMEENQSRPLLDHVREHEVLQSHVMVFRLSVLTLLLHGCYWLAQGFNNWLVSKRSTVL